MTGKAYQKTGSWQRVFISCSIGSIVHSCGKSTYKRSRRERKKHAQKRCKEKTAEDSEREEKSQEREEGITKDFITKNTALIRAVFFCSNSNKKD